MVGVNKRGTTIDPDVTMLVTFALLLQSRRFSILWAA